MRRADWCILLPVHVGVVASSFHCFPESDTPECPVESRLRDVVCARVQNQFEGDPRARTVLDGLVLWVRKVGSFLFTCRVVDTQLHGHRASSHGSGLYVSREGTGKHVTLSFTG